MGDFSRDPTTRLTDSVAKHYVGVRLQQGVPILDADWNELEDLRRYELETVGTWFLGDGVPVGSDGFRIAPLTGVGVNTIAIASASTDVGLTSIAVDVVASTAAAALGFDTSNATAERFGSSPAQVTGSRSEPFSLADGQTLVVQAEGQPEETVTFQAGDFGDITAATADEVIAAFNLALGNATASRRDGNDFFIRGGDGTTAQAGRILVEGRVVLNEQSLRYTEQPLFNNDALAELWGVDPVAELETPVADDRYTVYLDVWHREVDSTEDSALVDVAIGVETANRLRREWAVRLATAVDFLDLLANRPESHTFYVLAHIDREGGNPVIGDAMIIDERATEMSLRPEVAYRSNNGIVLVDSEDFMDMLVQVRDVVRDFISFLTARFVDPDEPYMAGEVAGIDALSAIAGLADQGLTLLHAQMLGTRGALNFFGQLLEAENRFISVWREAMLTLDKGGELVYQQSYGQMIDIIETFLTGPAPAGFTTITDALAVQNLQEAVQTQEQINTEFGGEVDRPSGVLLVAYLGSPAAVIQANVSFEMEYEITGTVTPEDAIDVEVFIDPAWQATLLNENGSLPFDVAMGPGDDIERFLVRVRPPNDPTATTQISLRVSAERNPAALTRTTPQLSLSVGQPPPGSEADFSFLIDNATVPLVGGVFEVPLGVLANFTYRLFNNTDTDLDLTFELDPETDPDWDILPTFTASHTVSSQGFSDFLMQFRAPGTAGLPLTSTLIARNDDDLTVAAQITVSLVSVT